jgi:hypothetical protein
MGCDIHMVVEVRKDGAWQRAFPPADARDPTCLEWAADKTYGEGQQRRYGRMAEVTWFWDRDYSLFGALAGIRSDTPPISPPRGLPPDLSPEVTAICEPTNPSCFETDRDDVLISDHSYSWLTLAELLAYDWRQLGHQSPFVTRVIPALMRLGRPDDVRIVFGFDS